MSASSRFILVVNLLLGLERVVYAEGLRDVKPPVDYPSHVIYLLILAFLGALTIATAVWLRIRGNKKRVPSAPILTPWERAFSQLEGLSQQDFAKRGDWEGYYLKLSDILRHYIEEQFQIRAPDMTTEEFLAQLKMSSELNPQQKESLKRFLESSDLVKFAKYAPDPSEAVQSFVLAKKFVEETKPQEIAVG